MGNVTQQNAANAEESASASEQLSVQAGMMNEVIGRLVALVGGGKAPAKKEKGQRRSNAKAGHVLTHKANEPTPTRHGLATPDHTWHQIADGGNQMGGQHTSVKPSTAKTSIPLDTDKAGFSEFNVRLGQ